MTPAGGESNYTDIHLAHVCVCVTVHTHTCTHTNSLISASWHTNARTLTQIAITHQLTI